jgi:hypothetical protein
MFVWGISPVRRAFALKLIVSIGKYLGYLIGGVGLTVVIVTLLLRGAKLDQHHSAEFVFPVNFDSIDSAIIID